MQSRPPRLWSIGAALVLVGCQVTVLADGGADAPPASCGAPGIATTGPSDVHCGSTIVVADESSCHGSADAGASLCAYGDTRFGQEADDDQCKYHLAWSSTPLCEGRAGSRFTVIVTNLSDGSPVRAADLRAETFITEADGCDDTTRHTGPNSFTPMHETAPGTYVGPVVFDEAGQWTVRFHVRDDCGDAPAASPHGHAAFRLTIP